MDELMGGVGSVLSRSLNNGGPRLADNDALITSKKN